jgi:hypothetical protein
MFSILTENDLSQMVHLARKKNILARFVMNGCHYCEQSQPEWDHFTSKYSGNAALAEIESSFLTHFQQMMAPRNINIQVNGFPTILQIKSRDVKRILSLQKLTKTKKNKKNKKKKTKRA